MNQMNSSFVMPDVQASADTRRIPIDRVGVHGVRFPLTWRRGEARGDDTPLRTVGVWSLSVALAAEQKGTHMSRFIALLEDAREPLDASSLRALLPRMLERLGAEGGRIEVTFPYFIEKTAPVSGVRSLLDYDVTLTGDIGAQGDTRIALQVRVPVTSLCPCSKEISRYGAHNQRSHITIRALLAPDSDIDVEALVRIAEEEASCELWGLLKRPDEKYVTERAYDNPKFVEDLVRDVAVRLDAEPRIAAYRLEAENFESIHNHSAYALIERGGAR